MSNLTDADLIQDAQMALAMRCNYPRHLRPGTDSSDIKYGRAKYVPKAVSDDRANGNQVLFIQDRTDHFRRPFWYNTDTGQYYRYEATWTRLRRWFTEQFTLIASSL